MNVVFCDVDGVLNHGFSVKLDSACICNLKLLLSECDAKLVVSSSWKTKKMLMDTLTDALSSKCVSVHDVTQDLNCKTDEILDYIENHHVDKYVVIDDDHYLLDTFKNRFIKVNPDVGLDMSTVQFAISIMEKQ